MSTTIPLPDLIVRLGSALRGRGWMCATAESCTGGLLGGALTEVPGASAWFAGGVIAYANRVKEHVLGVNGVLLEAHGAVSEPVVLAMVQGVCAKFTVPVGVSISGIAGPGGGCAEKPVGLVWMGFAVDGRVEAQRWHLQGNRDQVRAEAVRLAVQGLLQRV